VKHTPSAILGHGYAVPDFIRGNDAPIFDWLKHHSTPGQDLFNGLKYRRVLIHADDVIDIMVKASQDALHQAQVTLDQVDLIVGAGSVSSWIAPNNLAVVHQQLGLGRHCRVLPLNSDYTTFQDGVRLAHDLVTAGTARHVLVACGNNWTHHVDYHEPVSLAASDGAGAVVIGKQTHPHQFRLIDWDNETQSHWYGAFRMAAREQPDGQFSKPLMKLDDKTGQEAFKQFGLKVPGELVNRLLKRHGLTGQDITLIAHQTSKIVQDTWQAAIEPAHYISTLEEYGDMVSSSVPVNLARCHDQIKTSKLVLLGIGMEMHATALLLDRS
jgi:3-oxoacyl-[acyl-carrier-protein] synthase-3